jgi:hypothetical protein
VDWGAEKLGFKCPDCAGEELVRVGSGEDRAVKRPSLKRKPRRATAVAVVDEAILGVDADEIDEEELEPEEKIFVGAGLDAAIVEPVAFDLEETVVVADVEDAEEADVDIPEDLDFGEVDPGLVEEPIDETIEETGDWRA